MARKAKLGFEKTRTVHFEWRNERPEAFGYKFKSKAEFKWATYLQALLMSENKVDLLDWAYEPKRFQSKQLWWNAWRFYTPDFRIRWGTWEHPKRFVEWNEWHEVKTSLRQKDVTRFRWFRADYPEERIVLVLTSKPTRSVKQKILVDNARKYVDDVIFAGPILRKLGL